MYNGIVKSRKGKVKDKNKDEGKDEDKQRPAAIGKLLTLGG